MNREGVRSAISGFLAQRHGTNGSTPAIDEGRNLFESGDVDSFGFLELLLHLSEQTGCEFDLSDTDPSELAVVGALMDHFASDA